jgi:hypothetical protein
VKYKQPYNTFELSDGSILSAQDCAKRFNINITTMYARLSRGNRDVSKLAERFNGMKPYSDNGYIGKDKAPKTVRQATALRNAYDPMSKLFLKMK